MKQRHTKMDIQAQGQIQTQKHADAYTQKDKQKVRKKDKGPDNILKGLLKLCSAKLA